MLHYTQCTYKNVHKTVHILTFAFSPELSNNYGSVMILEAAVYEVQSVYTIESES